MLANTQFVAALVVGGTLGNLQLFAGMVLGIIVPRIGSQTLTLSSESP
jgi:hypothetical protein